MRIQRNDYKWRADLRRLGSTRIGSTLKPLLRPLYVFIDSLLPHSRDFILRELPKGAVCAEIGTYNGDYAIRINSIVKPSKLYCIDPWKEIPNSKTKYLQVYQDQRYELVQTRLKKSIDVGITHIIRETSDNALSQIADNSLDFVYIDGDHSYNQVSKDLSNYWMKLKSKGILSGDDYNISETAEAVLEFAQKVGLEPRIKNFQFIFQKP